MPRISPTTVTVFRRFILFHVENTWAGAGGLEKLHRPFFSGSGAFGSEALGRRAPQQRVCERDDDVEFSALRS